MGDAHGHSHGSVGERALWLAFWLNLAFLVIELTVGLLANSLALLSDAGHMVSDVLALAIALVAQRLGRVGPTGSFTFGLRRVPVLGAFGNALALLVIALFILWEAWQRFQEPQQVIGWPVLVAGAAGLLVNAISAWWLHKSGDKSLNIRGALLHLAADALGSLGAIIAGVVLMTTNWLPIDALVSVVIATLIIIGAIPLLRDTVKVLLQSAPAGLDMQKLRAVIESGSGVSKIDDLHVWEVDAGRVVLSAILVTTNCLLSDLEKAAADLREKLHHDFGIEHVTFEWRTPEGRTGECGFRS
jgi:cobalt-zinc-cadmium efflux system protein